MLPEPLGEAVGPATSGFGLGIPLAEFLSGM